jgi:hypothetical protein
MAVLEPGQEGAGDGERVLLPQLGDGPCWTSDRLVISRDWVAFKEASRRASWNVIPYAAVSSVRGDDSGRIVLSRPDGLAVVVSSAALGSLEACTLLADGLSTNPAVSSAADQVMQFYLVAARSRRQSSLARLHKVNRSGATHTFHSMHGFHLLTGIVCVVLGVGWLAGIVAVVADPSSSWSQGSSPWQATWAIPIGFLIVWLGIRLVRVGVQISSEKMTIRGYFVTRTVNASEIRALSLQPKDNGEGQLRWIPQIELTSGKSFSIDSFDCGPARNPPRPEMSATIEDVRTLLGVKSPDSADQQGLGYSDDSKGSAFLQIDPAGGVAGKGKEPAEISSPVPGSQQKRKDAAFKARLATILFVILLVVTAGGTAVLVAGYNPNGNSPTDWTVIFLILGPFFAWGAWRSRNEYRKSDQLDRLADQLANAEDSTANPSDDRGEHPATG